MSLNFEMEASALTSFFQTEQRRYLLLGIQGAGMRALAQILIDRGHKVTGADMALTSVNRQVSDCHDVRWTTVPWQIDALPVDFTDICVYTPAISDRCEFLQAVRGRGIPTQSLQQCLSEVFLSTGQICVAGTHGKTTTSAMLAWILEQSGQHPASFIGGELIETGRSGRWGQGDWSVLESCEFSSSFRWFSPRVVVLTGIERDHFDCFPEQKDEDAAFRGFVSQVKTDGVVVVNGNCARAVHVASQSGQRVVTFSAGQQSDSDWQATDIVVGQHRTSFACQFAEESIKVDLKTPGHHNVANAIAAMAGAAQAGISPAQSSAALATFSGVKRRFELRGQPNGVSIIDDYAHHPTAIRETIQTARAVYPGRRVIVAFEPHQIVRTQALFADFVDSLRLADETLLLPVFPARESVGYLECCRVSGRLVRELNQCETKAFLFANLDQIVSRIDHSCRPSDVLIAMGAGRTNLIYDQLTERLRRHSVA